MAPNDPENVILTEAELRLVHALQINPRASWALLGEALDADPATVARLWQGVATSGRAWVSAYPRIGAGGAQVAFVEVSCSAGRAGHVSQTVLLLPQVASVEHTTGGRDLLLTLFLTDLAGLSRFILETLGAIDGVLTTHVHLATTLVSEGAGWRIRALEGAAARAVAAAVPPAQPWRPPRDTLDEALLGELLRDPRASFTDLAERTDSGVSTARRRASRLLADGNLVIRCEVAQPLSGWPVGASIWCRVDPGRLSDIAHSIAAIPEVRVCAATTGGPTNLYAALWLRSTGDLQRLESLLRERVPELEIIDRAIALVALKRMGRLLGDRGLGVSLVPVAATADRRAGAGQRDAAQAGQ